MRERFIPRLLEADPRTSSTRAAETSTRSASGRSSCATRSPAATATAPSRSASSTWRSGTCGQDRGRAVCTAWSRARHGDGRPDERVWMYAAGGYYRAEKDVAALGAEMRGYLERGYTNVKLKIGGASLADDLRRIEAVAEIVEPARIAVDANGRFDLATALEYGRALGALRAALVRGGRRPARLPRSRRRSRTSTRRRSRPARTCSPTRTPATSCATAGCARTATSSSSTPRSATG